MVVSSDCVEKLSPNGHWLAFKRHETEVPHWNKRHIGLIFFRWAIVRGDGTNWPIQMKNRLPFFRISFW
jgi:hypothetical protein